MPDADVDGVAHPHPALTFSSAHERADHAGNVFIAQPPLYGSRRPEREVHQDEKEFTREIMRRATNLKLEIQPNGSGTGAKNGAEGVELRTSAEPGRVRADVHKGGAPAEVMRAPSRRWPNIELKVDYKASSRTRPT